MNPKIELDDKGRVIWEWCDECRCSRPKGHDYHKETLWDSSWKREHTKTTSVTKYIKITGSIFLAKAIKKVTKKKPTAATLTRRRNKMFGMKTKALEHRLEVTQKNLETEKDNFKLFQNEVARRHQIEKEDWDRERRLLKDAEAIYKKRFDEEKALAFKTMELEFKGKMQEEVNKVRNEAQDRIQKGIEENFEKLKNSLAKLHEEGNAQTKFTEQIALKMMEAIKPSHLLTEK